MAENNFSKPSELRQDLVSGDWVVIATGRARRPSDFALKPKPAAAPKKPPANCPFEKLAEEKILVSVSSEGEIGESLQADWFAAAVPNKFPAFSPKASCADLASNGPYRFTEGVGFHEVIISRPHDRSIGLMTNEEVAQIARCYRERLCGLSREECVEYVSLLHNHGQEAGASVEHPHSQIIAVPVIPPDVGRSLEGSERHFIERKKCVHCVVIQYERALGERIVFENDHFIVIAPYASHAAFELRIFPKLHSAEFQNISDEEVPPFAEALRHSLAKLFRGLGNPAYNFFIHTAPVKRRHGFAHYHWHLEILPKTGVWGGFEFGTGMPISTIAPEDAASFLRSVAVP